MKEERLRATTEGQPRVGNSKWGTMQRSNKRGTMTWNNKWGVATLRNNNTHWNKPKVTKKQKNNLQSTN